MNRFRLYQRATICVQYLCVCARVRAYGWRCRVRREFACGDVRWSARGRARAAALHVRMREWNSTVEWHGEYEF